MGLVDILLLLLLAACVAAAVTAVVRRRKSGGCSCGCASCSRDCALRGTVKK